MAPKIRFGLLSKFPGKKYEKIKKNKQFGSKKAPQFVTNLGVKILNWDNNTLCPLLSKIQEPKKPNKAIFVRVKFNFDQKSKTDILKKKMSPNLL